MEFSPAATDVSEQMVKVVNYILKLDISPAEKTRRLKNAFSTVGYAFYDKMFTDNSYLFDSMAISSMGFQNPEDQIERLCNKLVQNYNLGRHIDEIIKGFYDSVLGDAQQEAFTNAISLGKHPTLTRTIVGETCPWCVALAGTHVYPEGELFARHDHCDCLFVVSGYNSRNGILTNYKKERR